jgi:hypothetical protein
MRIKICRKEAKECGYWLKLVEVGHSDLGKEREALLEESIELMKIFGSILKKASSLRFHSLIFDIVWV